LAFCSNESRYEGVDYRQCCGSGLMLPPISLGTWQNFGDGSDIETRRAILRRAFDRGVTHFDLANMYGPPPGSAETNVGRILREDFGGMRDELILSTKAGYEMWPGPYGLGASRKHIVNSLGQSLKRLGTDYIDIYYAHRPWPQTPMYETARALADVVKQGKALYVGVSSYSPKRTREMFELLDREGVRLLINQPSYSMLNRHIEAELLDTLDELSMGCIGFSALAQGLLTNKYLDRRPQDDELRRDSFKKEFLSNENIKNVRGLNEIAKSRGQSLAQMAIAWVLRDSRVTSALIGARNVAQLGDSLDALKNLSFTAEELSEIDQFAKEGGVDLWRETSEL